MFETGNFRRQIYDTITAVAGESGIEQVQPEIAEFLQKLASENEDVLRERELTKTEAERREIPHALRSVEELTREASRYAAADQRTTLELNDFEKAYRAKFCQVWPFCA